MKLRWLRGPQPTDILIISCECAHLLAEALEANN